MIARYRQWREEWGRWFVLRSFLQVFLLQGVLLLLVAFARELLGSGKLFGALDVGGDRERFSIGESTFGRFKLRDDASKSLRERVVVLKHSLKNALIPVVTVLGLQVAAIAGRIVAHGQTLLITRTDAAAIGFEALAARGIALLLTEVAPTWTGADRAESARAAISAEPRRIASTSAVMRWPCLASTR